MHAHTHAHTQIHLFYSTLDFIWDYSGEPVPEPISILLKQETVSGSDISWAICKSAPHPRQITMPASHHSVFLQARCPSCHSVSNIKALKAKIIGTTVIYLMGTALESWHKGCIVSFLRSWWL